jgi:predicted nucleic acid-binding protein
VFQLRAVPGPPRCFSTRAGLSFERPNAVGATAEALANVESLARLPHVRLLSEEPGFLDAYREVAGAFPVRGNLVPDAHLAVLLRQHGVRTLYPRDGDFKRFAFLEVRNPFA